MIFYITENTKCCEPEWLQKFDYIHIKAKTDGSETLIALPYEIDEVDELDDVRRLQKEIAQEILDEWIDDENLEPETGLNGEPVLQSKIDLEVYCG
jgi:hypothetical protein